MNWSIRYLLLSINLATPAFLHAQINEGSILYEKHLEGIRPEEAVLIGDAELRVTFKSGKTLTEITSLMYNQRVSEDENGSVTLIERLGTRFGAKQTRAEVDDTKSKYKIAKPAVEYVGGSKTVAGYECKKAIVTIVDGDNQVASMEVWYCDKIQNPNTESTFLHNVGIIGIPWMILESTRFGPRNVKMVAKIISTNPVDDSVFILDTTGYRMETADELRKDD